MLTTLTFVAKTEVDVSEHLGLAFKVAKEFAKKGVPVKDSEEYSVALLRLVEVAKNYKPEDGEFPMVACRQMKQAIIDSFRHNQRRKRNGNFEKANLDLLPERSENVPLPEELLYQLLADHPADMKQDRADKLLLVEVYLGGNKISDIAERLCVSRVTIYDRLKRCIARIRERHADLMERYEEAFQ